MFIDTSIPYLTGHRKQGEDDFGCRMWVSNPSDLIKCWNHHKAPIYTTKIPALVFTFSPQLKALSTLVFFEKIFLFFSVSAPQNLYSHSKISLIAESRKRLHNRWISFLSAVPLFPFSSPPTFLPSMMKVIKLLIASVSAWRPGRLI